MQGHLFNFGVFILVNYILSSTIATSC